MRFGKEMLGVTVVALVIAAEGEEVAHLLVEPFLGGANVPNAREQLVKVIPAAGILEPFVVHDESFDEVFPQVARGPLPELRPPLGADAVANGEDEVEVVERDPALHLPLPFGLNC